jgi:CRISPR-associated protein Csm5
MKLIADGDKRLLDSNQRRLMRQIANEDNRNLNSYDWKKIKTNREVEAPYINTLSLNTKKPADETNSIMRGVSVSDSLPIDNGEIMLARKWDASTVGNIRGINVIRETVKPGVDIRFKLTLDTSVKSVIDAEFLRQAADEYGMYYRNNYYANFKPPAPAQTETFDHCLVLGGGSGYFGKNLAYPMLGYHEGLRFTARLMEKSFRKHYHDEDIDLGISPHMMKYTKYKTRYWHMGVCAIRIEEAQ